MLVERMKILIRFLLLLFLIVTGVLRVDAQPAIETDDPVYGFDPLLYNGRVYHYLPERGTDGNQYIVDQFDSNGSITLRGITYQHQTLNFDIYNQKLVLKYKNATGSTSLIEISGAWVNAFDIDGRHFEIETDADTTKHIYQVLGSGTDKVMYYFKKDKLLYNRPISGSYYFSKVLRETYVYTGKRKVKYSGNRNFTSAFNQEKQALIKEYLHKNKVNVKKASDSVMTDLINYCKTLGGS
jgi:hypothetical protein